MKRLSLALTVAAIVLAAPLAQSQTISADALASEIRASGARAVLVKYFETPVWINSIRPGIESGSDKWLRIAEQLYKESDGAGTEELGEAIYNALPNRPFAVLREFARTSPEASVESFCDISFEYEVPKEGVHGYLQRVRKALASAKTKQEKAIAAACRRGLVKTEAEAKRLGLR